MITLNAAHLSASNPSSSVARIKWPVEETGRNSVTPSTMPRISAISRMGIGDDPVLAGGVQMKPAGGEPRLAEAAEPFAGDGGERRRLNTECVEPRRALFSHIVALEHQPLVACQRRARQPAEP